jgi:hypothetical protein
MAGKHPEATRGRGNGWLARRALWRGLLAASMAFFAWAFVQFYQPATGFSSLLMIGDALNDTKVAALRSVPHYVYESSHGYDGAYYVQLALHPTLDNPELHRRSDGQPGAIDNLPYRARRILFSWTAWLLGLGHPGWVVQAHALLNVICWFAVGALLLRWFPPDSAQNFIRWFGIMFSQGVCMSVRLSLVDLPSLLLVVLAVRWIEERRNGPGTATLALAGLGKETTLLAAISLFNPGDWRLPRAWVRFAAQLAFVALPLAAWMLYIRWKFGAAGDAGFNNFTLPFAGLIEKWCVAVVDVMIDSGNAAYRATLVTLVGITVQFGFMLFYRKPQEIWWRVGVAYAALAVLLSTPVWEGYPGAFPRVLLPMAVAFNVLVPRRSAWLPVLVAGNLAVLSTVREFTPPERDFLNLRGARELVSQVEITTQGGWYGPENDDGVRWRWTSGDATLRVRNASGGPLHVSVRGEISALEVQGVRIAVGDSPAWSGVTNSHPIPFAFARTIPPGDTILSFTGEKPAKPAVKDPRPLALSVYNLEVVVSPALVQP